AKQIAAHRACASDRRRDHDGITVDKATPFLKCHVRKRPRRTDKGSALWIIDGQVRRVGSSRCAGQEEWNRFRFPPAEIGRIAYEIPAPAGSAGVLKLSHSRCIVTATANDAPWQRALDRHD